MSGVIGQFNLDRGPADKVILKRMLEKQANRGPDGSALWIDESVGMGHCLLATTPEAVGSSQPLSAADGLTITSHARLDNRPDLLARLANKELHSAPDEELILAAYRRWGVDCAQHLVGDFAFAIWDANKQRLYCARDRFGAFPFYYHFNGQFFSWASEIHALLVDERIPQLINDARVNDYLYGHYTQMTQTFYRGIYRVPCAHYLVLDRDGTLDVKRYWDLDYAAGTPRRKDAEYVDEFRELFKEVVTAQLRSSTDVAAWLSGGVDSSSVVAMAETAYGQDKSGQQITPVCAFYDDLPTVDETRFMQLMWDKYHLAPEMVDGRAHRSFSELIHKGRYPVSEEGDSPRNSEVICGLMEGARATSARVALSGDISDLNVSGNQAYLADWLLTGRWIALVKHFAAMPPAWRVAGFRQWALAPAARRLMRKPRRYLSGGMHPALTPNWLKSLSIRHPAPEDQLRSQARDPSGWPIAAETEYNVIQWMLHADGGSYMEYAAAQYGLEMRFPFADARLTEFLFALPMEMKWQNTQIKRILRESMEGFVPDEIRLPGDARGSYTDFLDEGLQDTLVDAGWDKRMLTGHTVSLGYLGGAELQKLLSDYLGGDTTKRHKLARAIQVERWLTEFLDPKTRTEFEKPQSNRLSSVA